MTQLDVLLKTEDLAYCQDLKLSIGASIIDISTKKVFVFETHDQKRMCNYALEEIFKIINITGSG